MLITLTSLQCSSRVGHNRKPFPSSAMDDPDTVEEQEVVKNEDNVPFDEEPIDEPADSDVEQDSTGMSEDDEDEESENEVDTTPSPKVVKRKADPSSADSKIKKKSKRVGIDEEAERSDDDQDGSEEDEDMESDEDQYEADDFLVFDEEKGDGSGAKRKKKKRRAAQQLSKLKRGAGGLRLDEEDEQLVREAMAKDVEAKEEQEREALRSALKNNTIDNYQIDEDKYGLAEDDEDDMGDFIVDGEEGEGEGWEGEEEGQEKRVKKVRKSAGRRMMHHDAATYDQLREATDIFGDGYDDFGEEEEEGEDGEAGEGRAGKEGRKTLAKALNPFEYIELVENFCLDEDEVIRATDLPERYQLALKGREPPSSEERREEARWISIHLSELMHQADRSDPDTPLAMDLVDSIEGVLRYIQVEGLEPPFVWYQRRDYLHAKMTRRDLWHIVKLDEKWEALYTMRMKMNRYAKMIYQAGGEGAEAAGEEGDGGEELVPVDDKAKVLYQEAARLFPKDRYFLLTEQCYDEQKLKDTFHFLRLLVTDYEVVHSEYNKLKRIKAVRVFTEAIAHPAYVIGGMVRGEMKIEPPDFQSLTTEEVARSVAEEYGYRGNLIRAAVMVLACELSQEPMVRAAARDIFKSRGTISTSPTAEGQGTITPFHEFFGLHYIKQKPIEYFMSREGLLLFMRMLQAEQAGMLKISIDPPVNKDAGEMGNTFFLISSLNLIHLFLSSSPPDLDPYPGARQTWDVLRLSLLQTCVEQYLTPSIAKEIKRELERLGREKIIEEMARTLEEKLKVGPFMPPQADERETTKSLLLACPDRPFNFTICAIYQVIERQAGISLAYVDQEGGLVAQDTIPHKTLGQKREKIKQFLFQYKPDVIVLNSSGGENSRDLSNAIEKGVLKEIGEMIQLQHSLREEDGIEEDDDENKPYTPYIIIADDSLANIFKNSSRAKKSFPEHTSEAAAAISLARYVQEPLTEYCALWRAVDSTALFGYEALYLPLHPLQSLVQNMKDTVVRELERKLVDAVCDVGVDINKALQYDHYYAMLPFVAGLGLRKAEQLKKQVSSLKMRIDSRLHLSSYLSPVVETNAAGFIRITSVSEDRLLNPLDNTRIHPELYRTHDFAIKIAADAMDLLVDVRDPNKYIPIIEQLMGKVRRALVKRIETNPFWLDCWREGKPTGGKVYFNGPNGSPHTLEKELQDVLALMMLDEYAIELEVQMNQGKRRLQFELIKDELRFPWLDLRNPMRSLSNTEIFDIICRNVGQSLVVGQRMGCTVLEVDDVSYMDRERGLVTRRQKLLVRTETGLKGSVSLHEILDERVDETFNIKDYLNPGDTVLAVLIGVQKDRFRLDLTLRPSYINKSEAWWVENRSTDSYARRWWQQQNQCPEALFDSYFDQAKALEKHKEIDKVQNEVQANMQDVSLSANSSNAVDKPKVLSRVIHHPLFANVDFKAAEQRLREAGRIGGVIVRPSSKGSNFLTVTWAFQPTMFKHISIEERNRKAGVLGLSNELYVLEDDMKDPFSDLDDIFSNYVEPMNDLVRAMMDNKNFRPYSPQDVEAEMYRNLQDEPGRIPYFIRLEPGKPGVFVVTWLSISSKTNSPTAKTLRVEVRPKGFRLGNQLFSKVSEFIFWFKEQQKAALRQPPPAPPAAKSKRQSRFAPLKAAPPMATTLSGPGYGQTGW